MRWGIPEGIGEIRDKRRLNMNPSLHYKIVYKCNRPYLLVHENNYNVLYPEVFPNQNRPAKMENFKYGHSFNPFLKIKDWNLESVTYTINDDSLVFQKIDLGYERISLGKSILSFYYSGNGGKIAKVLSSDVLSEQNMYYSEFTFMLDKVTVAYFSEEIGKYEYKDKTDLMWMLSYRPIFKHEICYDENTGVEKTISFFNQNLQPVSDLNGINSIKREYDEKGRIVQEEYVYDEFVSDDSLLSKMEIEYDDNTLVPYTSKISFYSKGNGKKLCLNAKRGYAYMVNLEYISSDYKSGSGEFAYYNEKGELILGERGFSGAKMTFNFQTGETESEAVLTDGSVQKIKALYTKDYEEQTVFLEGSPFERFRNYYDGEHRAIKTVVYDQSGNEIFTSNVKYEECDGFLMVTSDSSNVDGADRFYKYDELGRLVEHKIIFKSNGKETGETHFAIVYNGQNISFEFYRNGKRSSEIGYARADVKLDGLGFIESVVFKDEAGNTKINPYLGFAMYSALHSTSGILISEKFLDEKGNPTDSKYSPYAKFEGKCDITDSFLVYGAYQNADGTMASNNGVSYFDSEINSEGKALVKCYDKEGVVQYEYIR